MVQEEKADFTQTVIFNAVEAEPLQIYKRLDYCHVLSKVLDIPLKIPIKFEIYTPEFYRKYLYILSILESDKNIDYLGEDFGSGDIYSFDKKTFEIIIKINQVLRDFIAQCSKNITTWEDINYEKGE